MKKERYLILILFLLLITTACVKEKAEELAEKATKFEDIQVPDNFDFSTTKIVTVKVTVDNPEVLTVYPYIVKIYDANPSESGKLLITGAVNTENYTYSPSITVPTNLVQVWVSIYHENKLIKEGYQSLY
jgi:hypothetical protein